MKSGVALLLAAIAATFTPASATAQTVRPYGGGMVARGGGAALWRERQRATAAGAVPRGPAPRSIAVAPVVFEGGLGMVSPQATMTPPYGGSGATLERTDLSGRVVTPLGAQREALLARVVQDAIRQALTPLGGRGPSVAAARHVARAERDLGVSGDALWLPATGGTGTASSSALDGVNVRAFADRLGAEAVLLARARTPKVIEVPSSSGPAGEPALPGPASGAVVTVDAQLVRARDGAVLWQQQQSVRLDPPDSRRVHRSLRGDPYQTLLDAAARAGTALGASLGASF